MISVTSAVLVIVIIFATTFVRATFGFGNALLAMPLLALTIGIQTATPLVAFVSTVIAVLMLLEGWRNIDLQSTWRLIVASFLGIPIGLLLLQSAPEALVKAILGIMLILFGIYNLSRFELPPLRRKVFAYPVGFVAGILGGAYNTNGPPIIVYGVLSRWPPAQFRATLQGYFVPTGMLILLSHGAAGLWTTEVLWLFVASLPFIALAMILGYKVSHALSAGRFERLVYAFLIVTGILLFF